MSKTYPITGKEIAKKVTPLIRGAKASIKILVYDWRWYPNQIGSSIQKFNTAIVNAKNRGVIIKAIARPDKTVEKLKELKIKAKMFGATRKMHAKMMIIDNKIAIVGSHNYTKNAFEINKEISIITHDKETIERLNQYFNNLWL